MRIDTDIDLLKFFDLDSLKCAKFFIELEEIFNIDLSMLFIDI